MDYTKLDYRGLILSQQIDLLDEYYNNAFMHYRIVLLVVRFVFLGGKFNTPFGSYVTEQEF